MTPIINPWLFYLFSISENLKILLIVITILLSIFFIMCTLIHIISEEEELGEDNDLLLKKWLKKSCIVLIISILGLIFIPDKATLIETTIASYATPDNFNATAGTIENFIDATLEKVDKYVNKKD